MTQQLKPQQPPAPRTTYANIQTGFKAPLQESTRSMQHAAILRAAGHYVEPVKQAGSQRCVFYYDRNFATTDLIEMYDARKIMPIPARFIFEAMTDLAQQVKRIIGGVQ